MIVVDTNVIGYLFLSNEKSAMSEEVLRKNSEWAAPVLWRSELRNVLTLYVRRGLMTLNDAQKIMNDSIDLLLGREYQVSSTQVLKLASESKCSAYDCEFVAVAIDLRVPFVTADKQLLQEFPGVAVALDKFCD